MINKIFLGLVAVAAAASGTIFYYAYSWLGSIGNPEIASKGYVSSSTLGWTLLWISFLVLAVVALISLWQSKSKWPLWITFVYFAVFSSLLMLNDSSFSNFMETNSLETEYTLLNPLIIAVLLVVLLVGVLAAQMLLVNVRVKVKKEDRTEKDEPAEKDIKGEE